MLTGFVAPYWCFRSALYFIACYFSRTGFQVCLLSCAASFTLLGLCGGVVNIRLVVCYHNVATTTLLFESISYVS